MGKNHDTFLDDDDEEYDELNDPNLTPESRLVYYRDMLATGQSLDEDELKDYERLKKGGGPTPQQEAAFVRNHKPKRKGKG